MEAPRQGIDWNREMTGTKRSLGLHLSQDPLAICRLAPDAPIPPWAMQGSICSVTRTTRELSIVCAEHAVPLDVQCEPGWRALMVEGPLDFGLVGILAALVVPLAEAGISIVALSTFDTDYIMVKQHDVARAVEVLRAAGHHVIIDNWHG